VSLQEIEEGCLKINTFQKKAEKHLEFLKEKIESFKLEKMVNQKQLEVFFKIFTLKI